MSIVSEVIDRTYDQSHVSRALAISQSLIGVPYSTLELVGGPDRSEELIAYPQKLDCVTFCETVIAGSHATTASGYEKNLRMIRYHGGVIDWRKRNHYLHTWIADAVENGFLRQIFDVKRSLVLSRKLDIIKEFDAVFADIPALPYGLAQDNFVYESLYFVGFITDRANLDYFHCGFAYKLNNEPRVMLRHASKSAGGVTEGEYIQFCVKNDVKYVNVLELI